MMNLQVATAREQLRIEALAALKLAVDCYAPNGKNIFAVRPSLSYDVHNNAAWVRVPKGTSLSTKAAAALVHPRDRNGKVSACACSPHWCIEFNLSLSQYLP